MSSPNVTLHALPGAPQAQALAHALGLPLHPLSRHRFPDGETLVSLPVMPGQVCVLYWDLHQPDDKLFSLLQAGDAARRAGAERLVLVAPYLPYLRQDEAFVPGQPVSAELLGRMLRLVFDQICTVDPHLHRVSSLDPLLGRGCGVPVCAAPAIRQMLRARCPEALLVGPDEESRQWVEHTAGDDFAWQVAHKDRHGDFEVVVCLPEPALCKDRRVVIVDDIASSGRTVARCAEAVLEAGAVQVDCVVTHGLFAGDAVETILRAGVTEVWSTDSVQHETNVVSLAPLMAAALRACLTV